LTDHRLAINIGGVMKQMILAFVLVMLPVTTHAANWIKISENPGHDIYVDAETIEFGTNTMTFWVMDNFAKAKKIGNKPYLSSVSKHQADFKAHTDHLLYISTYSEALQAGTLVESGKVDLTEPVIPGTIGATVHNMMRLVYEKAKKDGK